MPLLVQKGSAYRTIISYGCRTGQPLLGNEADASEAAAALSETLERKDGKNYIIIAHGDMEGNTDEYRMLKALLRDDMKLRYFGAPDLKDVGRNAYRFINAVSDFATHAEPLRKTQNYKENLFSRTIEGNPLIDRAYQMVCAA